MRSQLINEELRHRGSKGRDFNTTLMRAFLLYRLMADTLELVKLEARVFCRDVGLCQKCVSVHPVIFLNLKTAHEEQDCFNMNWLTWSSYFVATFFDAVENIELVFAMKRGLATHELTKYASKCPNVCTSIQALT